MNMLCVCGQEINSSSANPWQLALFNSEGKVLRGVCLHGVEFDFEPFQLDDSVEVLKGSWAGVHGKVKHKAGSGEIGVEILMETYGLVTIWILPENLKKEDGK